MIKLLLAKAALSLHRGQNSNLSQVSASGSHTIFSREVNRILRGADKMQTDVSTHRLNKITEM